MTDAPMSSEVTGELKNTESIILADILRDYGEAYRFDDVTCDEIAAMDYPEAFEATYGYLTQADLDADEILANYL